MVDIVHKMKCPIILIVPPEPFSSPVQGLGILKNYPDIRRQSLRAVKSFPNVGPVFCVALAAEEKMEKYKKEGLEEADFWIYPEAEKSWTAASLLSRVCQELETNIGEKEFSLWWAWADCPLLDSELAQRMHERHMRWQAEYTNADGWPLGFAPELIHFSSLKALAFLAEGNEDSVDRDLLFTIMQKDINSFDIETELASTDLRSHRLSFYADSRRNWLLIERFLEFGYKTAEQSINFIAEQGEALRSLPAFFPIQIQGGCPQNCSMCPYPQYSKESTGLYPTERKEEMSLEDFSAILDAIVDFVGDAVIDISLWGEPALHKNLVEMAKAVFARPSLSLIIETSGIAWPEASIQQILEAEKKAPARSGFESSARPGRLSIIVSLDAVDPGRYRQLRGEGQQEALLFANGLLNRAKEKTWIQALRLSDGEEDLDAFWQHWKEAGAQIIIQKYDFHAEYLPQRRGADLSPLKRLPCWHLMRDMPILIDGTVPACKEDLGRRATIGNVLKENIANIWERNMGLYKAHLKNDWQGPCRNCDEYYSWNY